MQFITVIMNYQKRLIAIFRAFVQKTLIPQIRRIEGNLQQWGRFNALLSNQIINYNELQIYVDTLPSFNNMVFEKKELPPHIKKQENTNYIQNYESSFNPSKTFGGEKSKNIIIGIRQMDNNDIRREHSKEFNQGIISKDDSFKKLNINSMPNIGNHPPQPSYQSGNNIITQSLDRLLRQLIENQQKIDLFESKVN